MEIIVVDTYEDMSKRVAQDIIETMQLYDHPLLCPATGDTTIGLYKDLVHLIQREKTDVTDWFFVSLDEWMGMNERDEKSTRYRLDAQLFHPLRISDPHICFFNGRADDPQGECYRIEQFIQHSEGIDLAVVGIGVNGHVGMNEPGTPASSGTHIAALDPISQNTAARKHAKDPRLFSKGFTLGLATLLAAKNIFLLASGTHKAIIIQKVLEGDISEEVPASLLRNHSGLRIYLDKDAASLRHTM